MREIKLCGVLMRVARRLRFASAKIKTNTRTCEISRCRYRASSRFAEINVKRAQLPAGIVKRTHWSDESKQHVRWLCAIGASRFNDLIELMTVGSTILRGRPGQTKTWDVLRKLIHVRAARWWSAGGRRRRLISHEIRRHALRELLPFTSLP